MCYFASCYTDQGKLIFWFAQILALLFLHLVVASGQTREYSQINIVNDYTYEIEVDGSRDCNMDEEKALAIWDSISTMEDLWVYHQMCIGCLHSNT